MFIEDTTPITALTVGNIKQLITDLIREQKADAIPQLCKPENVSYIDSNESQSLWHLSLGGQAL